MKKQASDMGRRQLLKALALGSAAGAAATMSGQAAAAPAAKAPEDQGDGYRETDHIRNYYATLRGK
ncbi:formate dehydrogenase [Shewanella gelidii]|uniref:Formate dehydrogenase accessory protein FdhX n=1 Tax=Shewanella gelidii TaxID=1642821 RepID=A0A917JYF6_9GAMM|nr:formate dehydrogenase [Shewanella gelidii]MCL1098915.1 formate dehydrogenase [Shewanella gelidii]GGI89881.1 formate dehydrogenase accessory protein FdhX [Shewanella gelidii]